MGFWDKALNVAKNVGTELYNSLERSANETRTLRHKYENLSDDELRKIANSGDGFFDKSSKEKSVAFGVLKMRRHRSEDI